MELCVRVCAFLLQGIGDTNLAHQCFRLALVNNNHHAEAYNNLAVLEMRKGHVDQVSRGQGLLRGQSSFFKGKLLRAAVFTCYNLKMSSGVGLAWV